MTQPNVVDAAMKTSVGATVAENTSEMLQHILASNWLVLGNSLGEYPQRELKGLPERVQSC